MDLKGKRTLLTGASSGIGRELALALGRKGALLALAARRLPELEQTAELIVEVGGSRPFVIQTDLSARGAGAELASNAVQVLGGIDILVNNAAVYAHAPVWALGDSDEARQLLETNYWSPLALLESVVPTFLSQRSGLIVTLSSVMLSTNWPRTGHYASSKAALSVIAETLAMELEGSGVKVLHTVPGPIATPMHRVAREGVPGITKMTRMSPLGTTEVLAKRIVRAMEREQSRVVYPGFNNLPLHFPRSTVMLLSRIAKRAVPKEELHRVDLTSVKPVRDAKSPRRASTRG